MPEPQLHVLRVFCADEGRGGNALGVFLDPPGFGDDEMQAVAAELGFAETVFMVDRDEARLRIFTPLTELPLAGHPLVGTSWLLHRDGPVPQVLRPPAGEIPTWQDGELTWLRASPEDAPHFDFVELGSADEVEALESAPDGGDVTVAWAWVDQTVGTVRARAFLAGYGVPEDEATGSAALRLCSQLGTPLAIHQGRASLIHVRPGGGGTAELGGRVTHDEDRPYGGAG